MVLLVQLLAMLAAICVAPADTHAVVVPSASTASVDLVLPSGGS